MTSDGHASPNADHESGAPVDLVLQDWVGAGGTATVVAALWRYFASRGSGPASVHVVPELPNRQEQLRAALAEDPRYRDQQVNVYRHTGRRIHFPQYWLARRRARTLGWSPSGAVVAGASLLAGSIVPHHVPLRVAWFGTTIEDERQHRTPYLSPARRLLYRSTTRPLVRLEARAIRRAELLLPQSAHSADLLMRGGVPKRRIEVVPVPIDPAVFFPSTTASSPGLPRVVFVGRANDPRKGLGKYLREHARSPRLIDAGLTVVSRDPPHGYSAADLEALNVRVTGWVEDLGREVRGHELFVLPSEQEGLGIVVLEAMASGLGVVALPCGGPEAILAESGGGTVVPDVERMALRVADLLDDPDHLAGLGRAGLRWVSDNATDGIVFEAFDRILGGS